MATYARKRLFVDAEVQGRFALRAVAYWLGCMTVVMGMAMLGRVLMKPTEPFFSSSEARCGRAWRRWSWRPCSCCR